MRTCPSRREFLYRTWGPAGLAGPLAGATVKQFRRGGMVYRRLGQST